MGEELFEFFRHVIQFALERIDVGNLVCARFSFITQNRSGGYGTVILRICPEPFGNGSMPLFET